MKLHLFLFILFCINNVFSANKVDELHNSILIKEKTDYKKIVKLALYGLICIVLHNSAMYAHEIGHAIPAYLFTHQIPKISVNFIAPYIPIINNADTQIDTDLFGLKNAITTASGPLTGMLFCAIGLHILSLYEKNKVDNKESTISKKKKHILLRLIFIGNIWSNILNILPSRGTTDGAQLLNILTMEDDFKNFLIQCGNYLIITLASLGWL